MAKHEKTISFNEYLIKLFGHDEGSLAKTVTIQVTDACNLACTYCYQINKHNHFIPIETGKKFIDDLLTGKYNNYCDYDNCQGIVLEFIGGEPFMAIDQVSELTDYFIQRMVEMHHKWLNRYKISVCSNGVLYFDPKVQEYITKHLNHLSFSISIDGNKELHDACRVFPDGGGSYDVAMAAVNDFRERLHGHMGSKMTLAPDNIMHTFQATKDFIASGYDDINLNTVYEEGWTAEHAKILYDQLKQTADYLLETGYCEDVELSIFNERLFGPISPSEDHPYCGGSGSMLAVDWKGDLYPCIRYMESSIGDELEPLIIGNVETGIMATPGQCNKVDCLKCITRRTMSSDECFYCPIASGCGCCTAYNYQYYGTADKRTTFGCIMHKARCLANAYYWNKYHILHGVNTRFKINIPDEWALEIIDENELAMLKFFESYTLDN